MKTSYYLKSGIILAALSAATSSRADDDNDSGQFSLSYRAAFNITAHYSGVGGFAGSGGASGSGTPGSILHQYDDGFVGVDASHNAGGQTSYWGYNNASQVVGDNVLMSRSSASAVNMGDAGSSRPQNSIELAYTKPLTGGEHWRLNFDGAFDWTGIHLLDRRALGGFRPVTITTDSYGLGGASAPVAPYTGTVSGPGTLLDSAPNASRSGTYPGYGSVTGSRQIDADYFGFKLGPSLDFPLSKYFSLNLGIGLALGVVDSEFSYNEMVTVSGSTQTHAASGHDTGFVWGGYARALANVHLSNRVSLFGGVEFDDLGIYNQTVGGETAHLDLSHTLYVTGGLSFRF